MIAPRIARRAVLLGAATIASARADTVLRVGDQRGNQRAVMEAANVLRDVPYQIVWREFPAAAPCTNRGDREACQSRHLMREARDAVADILESWSLAGLAWPNGRAGAASASDLTEPAA